MKPRPALVHSVMASQLLIALVVLSVFLFDLPYVASWGIMFAASATGLGAVLWTAEQPRARRRPARNR